MLFTNVMNQRIVPINTQVFWGILLLVLSLLWNPRGEVPNKATPKLHTLSTAPGEKSWISSDWPKSAGLLKFL